MSTSTRDAYLQLLLKSWSDEEFNARIDADPKGAAAEVGIIIPEHVTVSVVRHDAPTTAPAEGEHYTVVTEQADRIDEGIASGEVALHVPGSPKVDGSDLSVEELKATAAGYCCSCCC